MSIELKIKAKHLALEPAIIRKEERKLRERAFSGRLEDKESRKLEYKAESLERHRKVDVRNESRATHLARAYITGKKYSDIERNIKDYYTRDYLITPRVVSMVSKYSKPVKTEQIKEWFNG